jgi:hypothetical protein
VAKLNQIREMLKKIGFIDSIKIFYFKILQNLRKKIIKFYKPGRIQILKNKKIFEKDLYNKQKFIEVFPYENVEIIEQADILLDKKLRFLGRDFVFKHNINWNYDPDDKKEWEKKIYDERRITYPVSPKDPKIVWELNRHQYFFILAKAFYLTGDEKYAAEVFSHMTGWIKENPFGIGINWASPLEISIRLINWIFAIDLLQESLCFSEHKDIIHKSIYSQIIYLSKNLSIDRVVRTNHLLGELAGLFFASMIFKFRGGDKLRKKALSLFEKELNRQTFEEGISREQSTSYHRFIVDFMILIFITCQRFNIDISERFGQKLERMLEYLMYITMPDGKIPAIGDSDDGRGFKLSSDDFWNMRSHLSSGCVLFNRGDMKFVSQKFYEESYWLLGNNGLNKFDSILPHPPLNLINGYQEAGHYIIRSSWEKEADFLFIRAGEFGMGGDGFSSHSHDDLLSPIICLSGQSILVDSGTYVYNGNDLERNKFKSSRAHNIISWKNGISQPKQNFGWTKTYNAKLLSAYFDNKILRFEFNIDAVPGYKRAVTYDKIKRSFIIEDHFDRSFDNLEWRLHFSPDIIIQRLENEIVFLKSNKKIAKFRSSLNHTINIEEDYISYNYNEKFITSVIQVFLNVKNSEKVTFTIGSVE